MISAFNSNCILQECDIVLARFVHENMKIIQAEINKLLRLIRHATSKMLSNDAMPRWIVFAVEFSSDFMSNILLQRMSLNGLSCNMNNLVLHRLRHVTTFDSSLAFCHFCELTTIWHRPLKSVPM